MTATKGAPPRAVHYSMVPGQRTMALAAAVTSTRQNNASRVQCPHCPLTIAPSGLSRHIAICHDED